LWIVDFRIADCGLRIADCEFRIADGALILCNPQSSIRNPQSEGVCMDQPISYSDAGVDIETQDRLIASLARNVEGIGGFSGLFPIDLKAWQEPLLVASTDGVGTKLLIALETNRLDTVGIDLVAMVVNDLICVGAKPLFFLDYYAAGKLRPEQWQPVLRGIMEGCRQAGCRLLGGETAELPGLYSGNHLDLAGFGVGIVEKAKVIDGRAIRPGNVVVGIASSGLHSNGYSLARRVLLDRAGLKLTDTLEGETDDLATVLLRPTKIYVRLFEALANETEIHAVAHITGGGLPDNIRRLLPGNISVIIDSSQWEIPNLFRQIEKRGPVERGEMFHTFNMGIGLVVMAPATQADRIIALCADRGEKACRIGEAVEGNREVQII
jgi:phosphoribosylformylglycinamidine cyclo-ligase